MMAHAIDSGLLHGYRLNRLFFIHVWIILLWTLQEGFICYNKPTKKKETGQVYNISKQFAPIAYALQALLVSV